MPVRDADPADVQEALGESEHTFRQLAESLTAGLSIRDLETRRILYLNPAIGTMFGRGLQTIYDDPGSCLALIHPDDRPRLAELFARPVPNILVEYRIIRADGTMRWARARSFPICDEHGTLYRMAGLIEDITDTKRVEEERRRHRDELDVLVRARTAQIQSMERQRVEDTEWVATGRVAARVAHEINNPLAGIKQALLLVKDAVPAEHPHFIYFGRVEKEIDRITFIVRLMLDLYRPEVEMGGRSDATLVVREVAALLHDTGRESGVTIEVDLPPGPITAAMPETPLRQILINVLKNAIEASPPGGMVKVSIPPSGEPRILVCDHGLGIPEAARSHVFEPFFTTKRGKHLGLGLALARTIMESYGGKLLLEGEAGAGTVCQIVLPPKATVGAGAEGGDAGG